MKKRYNILISILCPILLIVFLIGVIPISSTLDISLDGYAVTTEGDVQESVSVSVQGKQRNYAFVNDEFSGDITITYESGMTVSLEVSGNYYNTSDDLRVCVTRYYNEYEEGYYGFYLAYNDAKDKLIIDGLTENTYFVCSADGSDADALISYFSALIADE